MLAVLACFFPSRSQAKSDKILENVKTWKNQFQLPSGNQQILICPPQFLFLIRPESFCNGNSWTSILHLISGQNGHLYIQYTHYSKCNWKKNCGTCLFAGCLYLLPIRHVCKNSWQSSIMWITKDISSHKTESSYTVANVHLALGLMHFGH